MRYILIFTLIFSLTGQAFVRTAWMLHYQWNRMEYARFCENKDRPQLHCDGQCHLKKQIAVSNPDDPEEPQLPEAFKEIKDISLFFEEAAIWLPVAYCSSEAVALPHFVRHWQDVPARLLLRPPLA